MPHTQTSCPSCKGPVLVEVQQLFDVSQDPLSKQKLLTNAVNVLNCPHCGYQGMLALPIVYHDPEKELLLTFFPPDLKTPINEQEKKIGPLINQIMNNLPQEKRKAYLLQPQTMLTYQTLIEKILEADGITKEMIEDQQKKIKLLERLLSTKKPDRLEIIKQEEELIDVAFFNILSRIVQSALSQGNDESKNELLDLQNDLFENTKIGKQLFNQAKETEEIIKALQDAGKDGLTREKLLEVVIGASSDIQVSMVVSLARAGMDYTFFQLLSEKIENAKDNSDKETLTALREKLLELTTEYDQKVQEEVKNAKSLLETIIESDNIEESVINNLESMNEFFIHNLEDELAQARKRGDLDRINKIEQVMIALEKANPKPEEIDFIEKMLAAENDDELNSIIQKNQEKITDELINMLNNIIAQTSSRSDQSNLLDKLRQINKLILKHSMAAKLKKSD